MSSDVEKPETVSVSSKGQITIPGKVREQFGIEEGDRLMAVPTEHGIVLKKIDLPSVEEFQERVEDRGSDLGMEEIVDLVHEKRGVKE